MNNEIQLTTKFVAAALVSTLLAWLSVPTFEPAAVYEETGELFYPELQGQLEKVKGLEVYRYDADTGAVKPFKVVMKNGLWVIPSHHDYPADAVEQLAKVAGAMFGLRKDEFRTDQPKDHEKLGLLDPMDDKPSSLSAVGTRVNLLDETGGTLASYIFGKDIEGKPGYKFVRLPGDKRCYGTVVEQVELSTDFSKWIETDLLKVERSKMADIIVQDYTFEPRTGDYKNHGQVTLENKDAKWQLADLKKTEDLDEEKVTKLVDALDELVIAGVRPKPSGLVKFLKGEGKGLNRADLESLQSKGFYILQDGRLIANAGQLYVGTESGIRYTLWFGELAYGDGGGEVLGKDGETGKDGKTPDKKAENRYMLITMELDKALLGDEPKAPKTEGMDEKKKKAAEDTFKTAKAKWDAKIKDAEDELEKLRSRFADWFYVISDEKFTALRVKRTDLVKAKEAKDGKDGEGPKTPGAGGPPGFLPPIGPGPGGNDDSPFRKKKKN